MSDISTGILVGLFTSLAATAISILGMWLWNRKRQSDQRANEIEWIRNEISAIKNQMTNGFKEEDIERKTILYELRKLTHQHEEVKRGSHQY